MFRDRQYQRPTFESSEQDLENEALQAIVREDLARYDSDYDGAYLRLFWARTLSCTLSPIFVSSYYALVWARWLNAYNDDGPFAQGPSGARWVYYVWFVVSSVGIGLSKYGLAGVEAAMLIDKAWALPNAMQLIAHCDKVSYLTPTRAAILTHLEDAERTWCLGIDSCSSS